MNNISYVRLQNKIQFNSIQVTYGILVALIPDQ